MSDSSLLVEKWNIRLKMFIFTISLHRKSCFSAYRDGPFGVSSIRSEVHHEKYSFRHTSFVDCLRHDCTHCHSHIHGAGYVADCDTFSAPNLHRDATSQCNTASQPNCHSYTDASTYI